MRTVEEFGNTVEEAREKAFRALGVRSADEDGIAIEILSEGSPGSTSGWGRKLARVRVSVAERAAVRKEEPSFREEAPRREEPLRREEAPRREEPLRREEAPRREEPRREEPRREEPRREPTPRREAAPRRPAVEDEDDFGEIDVEDVAADALQQILDLMHLRASVEEREVDGHLSLNIVGPDLAILIGKHGQTLEALQFILNLIVNRNASERTRVLVDVGGYRQRRERILRDLAGRMARRAVQEQCTVALEPMQASERRIIHLALADDPEVETYSQGEEPMRKVIIAPRR